jgi:RsiW-degrading membrane proteinase PrsW (M82 family)
VPIQFRCGCGRKLQAADALAGRKTRCPQCQAVLEIPQPVVNTDVTDDAILSALTPDAAGPSQSAGTFDLEPVASRPSPVHKLSGSVMPAALASRRPAPEKFAVAPRPSAPSSGSIREYAYLLLLLALVPLVFSLLRKEESQSSFLDRIQTSLEKATPEELALAGPVLSKTESGGVELDDPLRVLPGGKLLGAHLPRDSAMHWIYAAIAAAGFLILALAFFSVERANPLHLLGIGLFTGTVGIVFLLLVQFCSHFRLGRIHFRGVVGLIMLILAFIGWSYHSALDPDSNFLLSMVGFTFGVGLCEELTKAIPIFFYFQRVAAMGWRGACLWGLASGVGFGVSEGLMYSGDHYNGISGGEIYIVRFVSCVALHAMWAASVGIAIAQHLDDYERVSDWQAFALFALRMLAVPMVLHGAYDTLLKKDMNSWALVTALISFAWLVVQIERARAAQPGAGPPRQRKPRPAY